MLRKNPKCQIVRRIPNKEQQDCRQYCSYCRFEEMWKFLIRDLVHLDGTEKVHVVTDQIAIDDWKERGDELDEVFYWVRDENRRVQFVGEHRLTSLSNEESEVWCVCDSLGRIPMKRKHARIDEHENWL